LSVSAWLVPLGAHEGDPKLVDLVPPHTGPGFRGGRPAGPRDVLNSTSPAAFPASGVTLLSWMTLSELLGGKNGNSLTGYVSPSGTEYALMGTHSGTAFVDVSDPGAPELVVHVPGPPSLWRDVRTYQQHAYMVSEGGSGIQVVDMTNLDAGSVTQLANVLDGGTETTHTLFVDEVSGFLYRSGGGNNGLRIYSLANPAAPQLVGQWNDRYTHEVTVVPYTSGPWAGKQIAFSCGGFNGGFNSTGLSILDVTDKNSIQVLKHVSYPGAAYCHQGWPSKDLKYFYINDELDENGSNFTNTKVIDITSLTNPVVKQPFTNQSTAIGHNLYVEDDRIYEANYTSGLRVFDNTNPLQPVEVAWFDTWPEDDDAKFNGLWNVYPYLPSGIVLGSDIDKGLFVWWVGAPLLDVAVVGGTPDLLDPTGQTLAVTIGEAAPGTLVPGSAELHYDVGAGWISVPLGSQGGGQFTVDLPALECGQLVDWYLSARSTNGITWTAPGGAPSLVHQSTAADAVNVVAVLDLEIATGWVVGVPDDDATDGKWFHADPLGSKAQPEDDHSFPGTKCWFTKQSFSGATAGSHDVDGGKTTLTSPPLDTTGLGQPFLGYWRWYSNNQGGPQDDVFTVQVSGGPGGPWVTVETVGPTGPGTGGGWIKHQFRVTDFVAATSQVRLRFIASDTGAASIVEAAVDDLEVFDVDCPSGGGGVYCTAKLNSLGCAPHVATSGVPSLSSGLPFLVLASGKLSGQNGLLFYAQSPGAAPFHGGTLCVGSPLVRTALQNSGGSPPASDCSGTYAFDFNAWAASGADPLLGAGSDVYAQYWSRDVADPTGFGSSLSDAVWFTLDP
ncbi:MAG TPA: choice-of-anchor B family protein, partial [Planctomycetota bacterium]|nr:choice-of-anchor B family protein [Planctomycetota bacterium]